jgi:hypothetical protein
MARAICQWDLFFMRIKTMFIAASLFAAALHGQPKPEPKLSVDGAVVTAKNFKEGATILFFGVGLDANGRYSTALVHRVRSSDDDGDGSVSITSPWATRRAVWTAIDLSRGSYSIGTPNGYQPGSLKLVTLKKNDVGEELVVEMIAPYVEVVFIRPGEGSWRASAFEGGQGDGDDQANHRLDISADAMTPLDGSGEAPKHFKEGDLIVGVDPIQMNYFLIEVGK